MIGDWLLVRLRRGAAAPVLDGIDLNVPQAAREATLLGNEA